MGVLQATPTAASCGHCTPISAVDSPVLLLASSGLEHELHDGEMSLELTPLANTEVTSVVNDEKYAFTKDNQATNTFVTPRRAFLYGSLVGAQLCFSGFHVFSRYDFEYLSPLIVPGFRSMIATPLLFAMVWYTDREALVRLRTTTRKEWAMLCLLGLTGASVNQLLFITGLALTTAADAGLSQPLIALSTLLLQVLLKREQLTGWKIGGCISAFFGCLLIFVGEQVLLGRSEAKNRLAGWLILLVQTCLYAWYVVLAKPVLNIYKPITLSFIVIALGGIINVLVFLFIAAKQNWAAMSALAWIGIVYSGVFGTVAAQALFSYGNKYLPASVGAMSICLSPLFSGMAGFLFLGERVTYLHFIGGFFIIGSIFIVSHGRNIEIRAMAQIKSLQHEPSSDVEAAIYVPSEFEPMTSNDNIMISKVAQQYNPHDTESDYSPSSASEMIISEARDTVHQLRKRSEEKFL